MKRVFPNKKDNSTVPDCTKMSKGLVSELTVDRPHDGNYKMFKFKNTYTQDNRQLFQIIGQIHGKMLLNIDLFTLSCG